MQVLKATVIFMGILIAAGMVVVGITIYKRATAPETAAGGGAPPAFGVKHLDLPRGTEVERIVTAGDRLILHLQAPGTGQRIVILDMNSGAVLGTLELGGPR